jgi:hypothetical protein
MLHAKCALASRLYFQGPQMPSEDLARSPDVQAQAPIQRSLFLRDQLSSSLGADDELVVAEVLE